jgi:hypothetical protein
VHKLTVDCHPVRDRPKQVVIMAGHGLRLTAHTLACC